MTQVIANSSHDDMIHDAVLDYYGRRLATCSSDKTIKIFEVEGDTHRLTETLKGHEGAVWCVSWAHPKYGNILASSSYDGKVFIWREQNNQWTRVFDFALHTASVNLISWSPHDCGCLLACASSDGCVSVLEFKDNSTWDHTIFPAHGIGANAVSWAPSILPGALEKASTTTSSTAPQNTASSTAPAAAAATSTSSHTHQQPVRRLATGGSDCLVRIWEFSPATGTYAPLVDLAGHTDWVRDVSWSPTILGKTYVASASQDRTVRVWTLAAGQDPAVEGNWRCVVLNFECVLWRVSWSLSGNVLAVSGGDNKVSLWKERVRDGGWECVKTIEE